MKLLGLIGGVSWVSTIEYYRLINEGINQKLGGSEFARCIIHSLNFGDIRRNNERNDWEATFNLVSDACVQLKNSGAEGLVLCANTMHMIADRIAEITQLPVIHIAEATATEISQKGLKKVGLIGTRFTMEKDFFKEKLALQGIKALIPGEEDREFIQNSISEELGSNIFLPATRERYINIIEALARSGAEGIILGCTEIPLLIKQEDVSIPVFDTTAIHSAAAVNFALS